ncbi:hypothetical protein BHAOGJBA_0175 [Methylobacterium hispanicum]|uniref:PAS domain-containing protein n=1 Tax=Methylobacterium hispanicum TaxID=270350 RepID=A0AAV4ZFA5_9HYPH|nr:MULTISPECIES: PAS domain-containing protein [Methylobacterium]GJD86680.1 hypothetical protein BHAOGJBA_0175 [Methylobacterium hispanicum]
MIFVADATGLCVHIGDEWTALTGQPVAEGLGHGWVSRVHPEDRGIVLDIVKAAARTASEFSVRYRILRPENKPCWVAAGCVPSIGFPEGKFIGYLGSLVKLAEDSTAGITAYGHVGRFTPPPAHGLTAPQDKLDRIADHLIMAHSLIESDGAKAALPGLRMALFEVGRALAARDRTQPILN